MGGGGVQKYSYFLGHEDFVDNFLCVCVCGGGGVGHDKIGLV